MREKQIRRVKDCFDTPEIYAVYAYCMYLPTWEKFRERAKTYMADNLTDMYACFEGGCIAGVIAVKREPDEWAEVLGIAVNPDFRGHGVGTKLIDFVLCTLTCKGLAAETDDDAVGFYEKYGFEASAFLKNGVHRRYRCIYRCGGG